MRTRELIAYLARGRHYRTAYLSLTRGDGGQNVLGPEFGDELGVIRTQELLAARRIDGGRQFFSPARLILAFPRIIARRCASGTSSRCLSDMVRVIREFRPDVVITRFFTGAGPAPMAIIRPPPCWPSKRSSLPAIPKAFPDQLEF